MELIKKPDSHWYKDVEKMKSFALVSADHKGHVLHAVGKHWNPDGPITKYELAKHYALYSEAMERNGYYMCFARTDDGYLFYEVDESEIPDRATTELDQFFVIKIDENGDKILPQKNIVDEFDLWYLFKEIAEKVARLETYLTYRDKSRLPEIYELKEGFIAQKLTDRWECYEFASEPVEYNAKKDKELLDEIQEDRRSKRLDADFITMREAFEFFLKKFN